MKLIIGLGNPEPEYQTTRHNTGFLVIDKLLADSDAETKFDKKTNAEVAKTTINKKRVLLAKPQTYMNNSGIAARALLDFYKLKPGNLIVIHDDKDIPLGETRVQTDRGPAGHNGIKSVIEHLGTQNFTRIRVGVAPASVTAPRFNGRLRGMISSNQIKDTGNFVLGKFTAEERKKLNKVIENITKELESLI
jgi:PTH1 family peptidyl-tRNA hydrolase